MTHALRPPPSVSGGDGPPAGNVMQRKRSNGNVEGKPSEAQVPVEETPGGENLHIVVGKMEKEGPINPVTCGASAPQADK